MEDQQKINKFARNNAKLNDVKDELKNKKVCTFINFHISLHSFFISIWPISTEKALTARFGNEMHRIKHRFYAHKGFGGFI